MAKKKTTIVYDELVTIMMATTSTTMMMKMMMMMILIMSEMLMLQMILMMLEIKIEAAMIFCRIFILYGKRPLERKEVPLTLQSVLRLLVLLVVFFLVNAL